MFTYMYVCMYVYIYIYIYIYVLFDLFALAGLVHDRLEEVAATGVGPVEGGGDVSLRHGQFSQFHVCF